MTRVEWFSPNPTLAKEYSTLWFPSSTVYSSSYRSYYWVWPWKKAAPVIKPPKSETKWQSGLRIYLVEEIDRIWMRTRTRTMKIAITVIEECISSNNRRPANVLLKWEDEADPSFFYVSVHWSNPLGLWILLNQSIFRRMTQCDRNIKPYCLFAFQSPRFIVGLDNFYLFCFLLSMCIFKKSKMKNGSPSWTLLLNQK